VVKSAGLVREAQLMAEEEPGRGELITPLDLRKIAPIEAAAVSDRLGWVGLEAAHYCEAPAFDSYGYVFYVLQCV
jgi:hypothetical protein